MAIYLATFKGDYSGELPIPALLTIIITGLDEMN